MNQVAQNALIRAQQRSAANTTVNKAVVTTPVDPLEGIYGEERGLAAIVVILNTETEILVSKRNSLADKLEKEEEKFVNGSDELAVYKAAISKLTDFPVIIGKIEKRTSSTTNFLSTVEGNIKDLEEQIKLLDEQIDLLETIEI